MPRGTSLLCFIIFLFFSLAGIGKPTSNFRRTQAFQMIVDALKGTETASGGAIKSIYHIKSRFQRVSIVLFCIYIYIYSLFFQLKSEYREVKKLREASGFGWNSSIQMVTASADVWEAYIKVRLFTFFFHNYFLNKS